MCDPGWFQTNCSDFVLEAWINGSTNECQGVPMQLPLSAVLPGRQTVNCSEGRTAWNGRSSLQLSVKAAPKAPISCQLTARTPLEARPASPALQFTANDHTGKSCELLGSVDMKDDGDQDFEIGVQCTGNDRTFNMAGVSVRGSNLDVPFLNITSIFPTTVAYVGTQITIRGKHFAEYRNEIEVFVGGIKVRERPHGFFCTVIFE